ncbi:MAG: S26 family signal peptidase [Prevotellaceae bacterium]|nr:S26 family signal peptidase [Prevotellaceae bacterium]
MNNRLRILLVIIGALLVAALLRGCVATSYRIPCQGMQGSLYSGERILVNRWSYGLRLPLMALWGYRRLGACPVSKNDLMVFNNPAGRSTAVISRREVFIGRCLATAGDTLWVDNTFLPLPADNIKTIGNKEEINSLKEAVRGADGAITDTVSLMTVNADTILPAFFPLIIPARGRVIDVHPWNRVLLCNTLLLHERRRAEIKHDTLFVDGKPVNRCRFTKDYYWVGADNTVNPGDSRLFGFVPQDHLIGKAACIWLSLDDRRGWFNGHIRWKRMFRRIR